MTNQEKSNSEIINWGLFTGALICSWFTMFFFFTIPIGLIIWTILLVILFVQKSKLKWFLIIFSGWTVVSTYSFIRGTCDYFSGKATIIGVGLPGPEFHNLNRQYRVWHQTSGCMVIGIEIFTHNPRNFATQFCTKIFGYQKGVYTGFYPDKDETRQIITNGADTVKFVRQNLKYTFKLNSNDYTLTDYDWNRFSQKPEQDSSSNALIVVKNEELIIFKPIVSGDKSVTYLADKKNGKVFARYYDFAKKAQ